MSSDSGIDPQRWLREHGDYLFRFALRRVGRRDSAEDLVQETLLAGLQAKASFAGRSSERTWLAAILKNKILDGMRRHRPVLESELASNDPTIDAMFDWTQHWRKPPRDLSANPSAILERREFWQAFDECRQGLPDRLREILTLRVLDDVPTPDICEALKITAGNLWTMLHRARLRLYACLDAKGVA